VRPDIETCRDPDLLAAEVRRLRAVIAAGELVLTDSEREAVARLTGALIDGLTSELLLARAASDQKPTNCDCSEAERRMHAEIEELRGQLPRWIPVGERLPPPEELPYDSRPRLSEEVLAAYQFEDGSYVKEIAHYDHDSGRWWDYRDKWHWAPTHWMPILKDPEDKPWASHKTAKVAQDTISITDSWQKSIDRMNSWQKSIDINRSTETHVATIPAVSTPYEKYRTKCDYIILNLVIDNKYHL